jgi:hypothetical protein
MAAATGTEQGKTSFVEEFLKDHKDADLAAVNAAWRSFGREGTISESLFGKTRRSLGLTRKRTGKRAKPADVTPGAMTPAAARKVGMKTETPRQVSRANAEETPTRQNRRAVAAATSRSGDRNQMLIALEKDLDRLLFGVLEMESMTEVEEFIRSARRVVSREIR